MRVVLIAMAILGVLMSGDGADATMKSKKSKKIIPAKPEEVLKDLQAGNARYVSGQLERPHQSKEDRERLVAGQNPPTVVLACSDSRVMPELIFDKGLGDLFVVRVAGNVVNPENIASIEFAVKNLSSSLIVVLGHEGCGAVNAAINISPSESAGSPSLDVLVHAIRSNIQSVGVSLHPEGDSFRDQVIANVQGVIEDLNKQSPVIGELLDKKKLKIIPAIYSLGSGKVAVLNAIEQVASSPSIETAEKPK